MSYSLDDMVIDRLLEKNAVIVTEAKSKELKEVLHRLAFEKLSTILSEMEGESNGDQPAEEKKDKEKG